ncbi:MAG: PAS domain S-box protein [Acidobacteriia bacterium]|nr:PAS domain S-box protein [Terriglobia bacterium]
MAAALGLFLALVAQFARIPLDCPTLFPYIIYLPFIMVSASIGGLAGGVMSTFACTLGALLVPAPPYFGGRLAAAGLVSLLVGGTVTSILFERLKRAHRQLTKLKSELSAIYENAPVHLLVVDSEFRVQKRDDLSAGFSKNFGVSTAATAPGEVLGCCGGDIRPAGMAAGLSSANCLLCRVIHDTLTKGSRHNSIEVWLPPSTKDHNQSRCFLVSCSPIPLAEPKAVVWAQDITGRKRAEERARESGMELDAALAEVEADHSLLNAVFAAQPDGIFVCSTAGKVILTNPATIAFFGFNPTGMHVSQMMEHLHICGGIEASLTLKALVGQAVVNVEQTAGDRVFETSSAPIRDRGNSIIGAVTVTRDITVHRRIEEALRSTIRRLESALAEKTVLLQEVHHRVKNNLAVVSSLLGMRIDLGEPGDVRDALEESRQRIRSIALIHDQLYGGEILDRINFAEYARQLLLEVSAVAVGNAARITIQNDLDPIELGVDRAVPCALILNELVLNALKHAFPADRHGEIRIGFRETEPGFFELSVEDDGIGCRSTPSCDGHESLGLRIVQILTKQLGGSLRQEPSNGTHLVLRFPADSSRPASSPA